MDGTAKSLDYGDQSLSAVGGLQGAIVKSGGKTWFYLTADYTFGSQLGRAWLKDRPVRTREPHRFLPNPASDLCAIA